MRHEYSGTMVGLVRVAGARAIALSAPAADVLLELPTPRAATRWTSVRVAW
jgi:hypothetical protein